MLVSDLFPVSAGCIVLFVHRQSITVWRWRCISTRTENGSRSKFHFCLFRNHFVVAVSVQQFLLDCRHHLLDTAAQSLNFSLGLPFARHVRRMACTWNAFDWISIGVFRLRSLPYLWQNFFNFFRFLFLFSATFCIRLSSDSRKHWINFLSCYEQTVSRCDTYSFAAAGWERKNQRKVTTKRLRNR